MKRFLRACALALLAASPCLAGDTTVVGDAWVTGKMGVGTTSPGARLEVVPGASSETVFQVSGVDETPFLHVGKDGEVGLSTQAAANLDVSGTADAADLGLQLDNGNLNPATSRRQITLGNGTSRRHVIRSAHSTVISSNSVDFLVWNPAAGSSSSLATMNVLSLVTTSTGTRVHIRPVDYPDVDLEVSNGSSTGGGDVHRAAEVTPSSREIKSDLAYLGEVEERRAYEEVQGLRHAVFRYKRKVGKSLVHDPNQPLRRGLIFEDSPESLRGTGESIVVDERVNNAEMGLKELIRRLEDAQARAARLEGGP